MAAVRLLHGMFPDNDNIDFLIRFGSMCSQLDLLQAIFMLIYEETKVLEL